MATQFSEQGLLKIPVVGILRGYTTRQVESIASVYADAGFTTLEITLNSPEALKSITQLQKHLGHTLNIGAGTVLSVDEADDALHAGASFIVSPNTDLNVVHHCVHKKVPIFPGAFTPSEIYAAWNAGARMVKLFPASSLGPAYIKNVLAPFNSVALMPTGGITSENISDYYSAGASAFGMGDSLFNRLVIQEGNWKLLSANLASFKSRLSFL